MPSPLKSQDGLPPVNECCEFILAAAVVAKLTAQKGERFIRISNGDIGDVLHSFRKDAVTARRDNSKKLVTFNLKVSADRRISMQLRSSGVDALSYYSNNQGQSRLAPFVAKCCAFVNSTSFEAKAIGLVGEIDIRVAGSIQQFSNFRVSVKGNTIQIE